MVLILHCIFLHFSGSSVQIAVFLSVFIHLQKGFCTIIAKGCNNVGVKSQFNIYNRTRQKQKRLKKTNQNGRHSKCGGNPLLFLLFAGLDSFLVVLCFIINFSISLLIFPICSFKRRTQNFGICLLKSEK